MKRKFSEILLIDDDAITNYITHQLLLEINIGEKITIKQNAGEALSYVKFNWSPSKKGELVTRLILLDLSMPLMNGFEFLDHFLLLQIKDVRIFMLTTSESSKDIEKARDYKIEGYLIKPLETNPAFIDEMKRQVSII